MAGSTVGREIERKFLVKSMSWKNDAAGVTYRQGYLSLDPDRAVRVRIAGNQAWLTIKSRISERQRREFEYAIPISDAEEMLREMALGLPVVKTRYIVNYGNHTFEIDCFEEENRGLVVAEVELSAEDEAVMLPPWLGTEVTDDPKYLNINLSQTPFSRWNEKKPE